MLIEGQAVHLLKTTGSYTGVCIPHQRSVRSRGWGKSQAASTPLTCCGPFRTLAALELGGKAKSPPGRWMERAPCQMIWTNLAEPVLARETALRALISPQRALRRSCTRVWLPVQRYAPMPSIWPQSHTVPSTFPRTASVISPTFPPCRFRGDGPRTDTLLCERLLLLSM